jgi:hypothetical protein
VEQDDEMEKHELDNKPNTPETYVSCYPNARRYSMATVRPPTTVSQGYNNYAVNDDDNDDDDDVAEDKKKRKQDTKIEIPTSQPPQYSPAYDKNVDKKVKVSG